MAYDAETIVNANERFKCLRNLIAELPDNRFDYMNSWSTEQYQMDGMAPIPVHECKNNMCILGWARVLYGYWDRSEAWEGLGLTEDQGLELFFGGSFPDKTQAIRTMDHLAETGIVDWTV